MYMNKFFGFIGLIVMLAGCGGDGFYYGNSESVATSNPTDIQESFLYSTSLYGSDDGGPYANIAVLLPTSGTAKTTGNEIKTSIETAFLRKTKSNLRLSFFDLSGNIDQRESTIRQALATRPDVIIGPLFAEDTKMLRDIKPSGLPVISFTSDVQSLGDGVMTVNLIPTQSIETIIREMKNDERTGMVVFAPNNNSGQSMMSVAKMAADLYDIPVRGVYYYDPGKSDSIKTVTHNASLYNVRSAVNTRAREVLSDILTNEEISPETRTDLSEQLENISRTETLGELPYDSILFLGNGADSKTLASFLRYYGISNRDVAFYGTTLWQNSEIASDLTMSGAKYATLPEISTNFTNLNNMVAGKDPTYLSAFGYDAANLALGMLYAQKNRYDHLHDKNGYIGTCGIFRILPSGKSERALRIMELNGSGTPKTVKNSASNFLVSLYNIQTNNLKYVSDMDVKTRGINPGDYITIPDELSKKSEYRTRKIGLNNAAESEPDDTPRPLPVPVQKTSESEIISNPEFENAKPETVSRQYIDSVEIQE